MASWDRTAEPRERMELRARAVQAVIAGEKKIDVARRFAITRQTLHNWVIRHRLGGAEALTAKPPGRARRPVLESWQEAQIADAIRIVAPGTVNPRYTRWTKRAIAEYVELSFGVRLNAWQVDSHVRRWGFGSHKEVRQAFMSHQARKDGSRWSVRAPAGSTLSQVFRPGGGESRPAA